MAKIQAVLLELVSMVPFALFLALVVVGVNMMAKDLPSFLVMCYAMALLWRIIRLMLPGMFPVVPIADDDQALE